MEMNLFLLVKLSQSCFMVCLLYEYQFINEKKNWTEAQRYCREKHTDLATATNITDMKRLLRNSPWNDSEAWIGLYDQKDGNRTWYWSLFGVEFNEIETNWKTKEPNDLRTENCAAMLKSLKWNDVSYKLILIKENKTWEDALYYCRDHYHDLVTITNLDEQRRVQEKAKNASTDYVWMGLRYTCTLDFWFWVSDEVVSYQNWASDGGMDDCDMSGAMETGGQNKWLKISDSEEFNFICSKL